MTPEQLLERVEANQKLIDHLRRLYRFSEIEAQAFLQLLVVENAVDNAGIPVEPDQRGIA